MSYTHTWECPGSHQFQLSRTEIPTALLEMLLGVGVAAQASSAWLWDQTPPIVASQPTYAAGARTAAVPSDRTATIFVLPRGVMGAHTVVRACSRSGDIPAHWPRRPIPRCSAAAAPRGLALPPRPSPPS